MAERRAAARRSDGAAAAPTRLPPTRHGSSGPGASSPAASTPRCARSRRSGGPRTPWQRGEGPYVWDVEGRRYIDMVQSYGAVLLGHAHPVVTEAVTRAAARGTTFGAPTEGEVLLAEAICDRVPGCEQVRLVSSGTEAAMSAVRVARGFTGRDRVVKFDGCYHGHSDTLLAGGGSGVATLGLPGSAGVPGVGGRRHHGRPLQRGARARRPRGVRDRGARGRQHGSGGARPGFPGRAARRVRRRRRAARLRRGDHRVPGRRRGDVGHASG